MAQTEPEVRLMQWLRDAHAMELQASQMLQRLGSRLLHYPLLQKRIEDHAEESRKHAEMVQKCIERRGGDTSVLKDTAGRFAGLAQGISGAFVGDEVVKGGLASYTFEHMEIASYRILSAAAEEVGDAETKRVCDEIARQEEAMAGWLAENLPHVTQTYLKREAASAPASR